MVVMAKSGHMGLGTFCVTSADALVHLMRHVTSRMMLCMRRVMWLGMVRVSTRCVTWLGI